MEKVRGYQLDCLRMCEQAQRYRDLATQCTQALTGMPGSGSKEGKQARYVILLMDKQAELREMIRDLAESSNKAEQMISTLTDPRHRAVLQLYYCCGKSMDEIAEKLSYDRTWVYRLREDAISILDKKKAGD